MKSSIIINRIRLEEIENQTLAPYAIKSKYTKGREYPEDEPAYRTVFQRDRDRILHTTAFRRLDDKTQVFVVIEGDYYRTRMTHTLEVSQIGRTIARALGANEDLVEAICLAHDLGHPPFGHAGERVLNRLMESHGGFEHNRQSLRIVTKLEKRYLDFPGLNLTWEVREGIFKHETIRVAVLKHFPSTFSLVKIYNSGYLDSFNFSTSALSNSTSVVNSSTVLERDLTKSRKFSKSDDLANIDNNED